MFDTSMQRIKLKKYSHAGHKTKQTINRVKEVQSCWTKTSINMINQTKEIQSCWTLDRTILLVTGEDRLFSRFNNK